MDDMTAFERQVQRRVQRFVGPARPVDDLAVYEAVIAAAQSPKWRFWSTSMPSVGGSYVRVTGRTQTMFSPVKAIIAGALVFALGGTFLIAQPFDQQGSVPGAAPGAVTASPSPWASPEMPVWVTGTVNGGPVQSYGTSWEKDGIGYAEGPWWTVALEASDPRLTAEGTYSQNWNESNDAQQYGIGAQTYVLDTPDGRWVGSGQTFGSHNEGHAMIVLDGQGGYEGLTATLLISTDFVSADTFVGVITPAEPPKIPEAVEPPAK